MPSLGSPSPSGSIQRRVMSKTYCFGPGVQVVALLGVGKLGQRVDAPPALVAKLILRRGRIVERLDDVPILVGRLGLLLAQVGEREEVAAGVIEHAVDDHADAAGVGLSQQFRETACRPRSSARSWDRSSPWPSA